MRNLKRIVFMNLQKLSIAMMVLILLIAVLLQVLMIQDQTKENAQATFAQVAQILQENKQELAEVEAAYRDTCLNNAATIAYIIQHNEGIIGDVEQFRMLAWMLEVDEIHIFDDTGRIFTGSHPEYYNFTFDTGEQIGFFRPMMDDKSLRLCQDITPNTAEGKLVQYSALWSADGQFIVQVGMYPETVLEVTEKNELSHIFSLLQGDPGVDLYAIDAQTGIIMGTTTGGDNGRNMTEIGFSMADMDRCRTGGHVTVSGVNSFCVFRDMEGTLIGYVISQDLMYKSIPLYTLLLAGALAVIELIILMWLWRFMNRYVISSISGINRKLRAVAEGDLDERVDEQSSLEFSELSSHINNMIRSLLASTDKMSFILNRTNMRIGVYEYNKRMKTVRFTEHVPKILDLSDGELERLSSDYHLLRKYIDQLRREPVPGAENVFRFVGKAEKYVRLEEIASGSDRLGIVMDVTEETLTRRRIENERDVDPLTGLHNRFGLERELARVFGPKTERGHGALIMIDADGLKTVNDVYGHAVGDRYLKRIAEVIASFGAKKHVSAHPSGDEFVLLIYGYEDEAAVMEDLAGVRHIQKNTALHLQDGAEIPVRFSFGYVLTHGRTDHQAMLSEADSYMYAVKRQRKRALQKAEQAAESEADPEEVT